MLYSCDFPMCLFLWEYVLSDDEKQSSAAKVLAEVDKWMERFDCLVIGPGLGRDPYLLVCISTLKS